MVARAPCYNFRQFCGPPEDEVQAQGDREGYASRLRGWGFWQHGSEAIVRCSSRRTVSNGELPTLGPHLALRKKAP
jgi:hypothetical protein